MEMIDSCQIMWLTMKRKTYGNPYLWLLIEQLVKILNVTTTN